jgi:hypothetical protein
MVGKNKMVGLGQFGLNIDRADEKVRAMVLDIENSPFFKKIITEQRPHKGTFASDEITKQMADEFGGLWPSEAAVFPVVAEGRVAAMLYCDNVVTGEKIGETEGLEIFISHAGLALEKSLLQRRIQEMEIKSGGVET